MTEHRRNIMVTDCFEAQDYYFRLRLNRGMPMQERLYNVLAEIYLNRIETLTSYNV